MYNGDHKKPRRLIRKPEVKNRSGFKSDSGLYDAIARGDFPKPIKIGTRASAWIESDIEDWIDLKIAASRSERAT
ncbi:MAG: AlpA family transcriptional regulator [Gammaproteobacteria bacterium]|nr:AlpA family transcriptional regulator [Gammaproteobacteria bacterium]